jgi:hypothetical protein
VPGPPRIVVKPLPRRQGQEFAESQGLKAALAADRPPPLVRRQVEQLVKRSGGRPRFPRGGPPPACASLIVRSRTLGLVPGDASIAVPMSLASSLSSPEPRSTRRPESLRGRRAQASGPEGTADSRAPMASESRCTLPPGFSVPPPIWIDEPKSADFGNFLRTRHSCLHQSRKCRPCDCEADRRGAMRAQAAEPSWSPAVWSARSPSAARPVDPV